MAGYDELSACLPHETLSELLSGGQVRPEIEAHLAACKSCQKRLDDLASADESHLQKLSSWSNFDTNKERVTQIPSYLRRLAANAPLPEVPGFQIIRELGSGGMAVVYLARDLQLHRQVALKILLTGGLSSAEQVARFQNEAEATAKLQHPNIVQIHRTGCHDGIPFIVLELVEGPTLQEFIKHRSATPHEVAEFVSQVARAIDAAHRQNIVHRDLKPNNILLGRDGANPASNLSAFVPKVADFGLARHLDRDPNTATGTLLGTPNYMSPEQVRGDKVIAGTTDVCALGTILYELLVGELPFDGDTPMEVFAKITHERPVGPSKRNPQVPIDIDRITTKCLEKEARDRYQSAADLADDLERFLQHLPVQARPVSRLTRAFRRLKRRPVVSGMAIMLLVMVCVLVGAQYWHNQVATRTARQIDESIYVRTIRLAETAWKSRDRTTLRTLLDSCSLDLRRAEWQLLDQLEKMRPTALRMHADQVASLTLTPDGRFILSAGRDKEVRKYRVADCKLISSFELESSCVELRMDVAGRHAVLRTDQGRVGIWSLDVDSLTWLEARSIRCIAASSEHVACSSSNGKVEIFQIAIKAKVAELSLPTLVRDLYLRSDAAMLLAITPGEDIVRCRNPLSTPECEIVRTPEPSADFFASRFSVDGQYVAMCQQNDLVELLRTDTGVSPKSLFGHEGATRAVAFSADRCITGGDDHAIVFWSLAGQRLLSLHEHSDAVTALACSNDGSLLVSGDASGAILVHAASPEQDLPASQRLPAHGDRVRGIAQDDTHARFATCSRDGYVRVWENGSFRKLAEFGPYEVSLRGIAWRPNSSQLAVACDDGRIMVLDASQGTVVQQHGYGAGGPIVNVAYSPDGKVLAAGGGETHRTVIAVDADNIATAAGYYAKHAHTIRWLEFDRSGDWFVSSGGSEVFVWNVREHRVQCELTGHQGRVFGARFHPASTIIVTSGTDSTIRVWNARTGDQLHIIRHDEPSLTFGGFLDNGRRAAFLNKRTFLILGPSDGTTLLELPHDGLYFGRPWVATNRGFLFTDKVGNLLFRKVVWGD